MATRGTTRSTAAAILSSGFDVQSGFQMQMKVIVRGLQRIPNKSRKQESAASCNQALRRNPVGAGFWVLGYPVVSLPVPEPVNPLL
jgi:hypothetical protein